MAGQGEHSLKCKMLGEGREWAIETYDLRNKRLHPRSVLSFFCYAVPGL